MRSHSGSLRKFEAVVEVVMDRKACGVNRDVAKVLDIVFCIAMDYKTIITLSQSTVYRKYHSVG